MCPSKEIIEEDSQENIIKLLVERPLTWKELLEETGFPSETLLQLLDALMKSKVVEKKTIFEKDRVVYAIPTNPEILFRERRSVAFDISMGFLREHQPSAYIIIRTFILAVLRTKIQAQYTTIDVEAALLNNLDNQITPEDAEALGLPDGAKFSNWIGQILKTR